MIKETIHLVNAKENYFNINNIINVLIVFYLFLHFKHSTLSFHQTPAMLTLEGSNGVPLNGEPGASHAFLNIS